MSYSLSAVDLADEGAQAVAAGQSHTCVLLESGEVACWGYNGDGQASAPAVAGACRRSTRS